MIRITTVHTDQHVVLYLEGRLAGEAVETLEREVIRWRRQARPLVLDFKRMGFIDEAGMALLQGWQNSSVRLCGASDFIKALLAEYGLHVEKGGNDG